MRKFLKRMISMTLRMLVAISACVAFSSIARASAPSGYNYNQMKAITLAFSQCVKYENGSLSVKSDAEFDWSILNTNINGVVILPYFKESANASEQWWDINRYGLQYSSMATLMANVVLKIHNTNSALDIWIGTPEIDSSSYASATSANCLNPFTNYISAVQTNVGNSIWNNRVKGVYYAQESIYGSVDYMNLNNNAQIRLMNDFAYRVHTNFGKDLLWIPYYGYGTNAQASDIIKKIGYIANTKPIFNCVVMQPHYENFGIEPGPISNITAIKYSVENQTVVYRNNVQVVSRSSSATAVIGAELEYNEWKYGESRIDTYIEYFSTFSGNRPLIFYWQGNMSNTSNTKSKINTIY